MKRNSRLRYSIFFEPFISFDKIDIIIEITLKMTNSPHPKHFRKSAKLRVWFIATVKRQTDVCV